MTNKQKDDLSNNILTVDILIESLVTVEKEISKCAYNRKKYQHADSNSYGSWTAELKENMQIRTYIINTLIQDFDMNENVIKGTVSSIDKRTIPYKCVLEIVKLIKSKNFTVN